MGKGKTVKKKRTSCGDNRRWTIYYQLLLYTTILVLINLCHNMAKDNGTQGQYQATLEELDDNLIRIVAVKIIERSKVTTSIYCTVPNYLVFFKQKRTEKFKARGCAGMRLQRDLTSKEESRSLNLYIYTDHIIHLLWMLLRRGRLSYVIFQGHVSR